MTVSTIRVALQIFDSIHDPFAVLRGPVRAQERQQARLTQRQADHDREELQGQLHLHMDRCRCAGAGRGTFVCAESGTEPLPVLGLIRTVVAQGSCRKLTEVMRASLGGLLLFMFHEEWLSMLGKGTHVQSSNCTFNNVRFQFFCSLHFDFIVISSIFFASHLYSYECLVVLILYH